MEFLIFLDFQTTLNDLKRRASLADGARQPEELRHRARFEDPTQSTPGCQHGFMIRHVMPWLQWA